MEIYKLEEVRGDSTSRNNSLVVRNSVEHPGNTFLGRFELEDRGNVPASVENKTKQQLSKIKTSVNQFIFFGFVL